MSFSTVSILFVPIENLKPHMLDSDEQTLTLVSPAPQTIVELTRFLGTLPNEHNIIVFRKDPKKAFAESLPAFMIGKGSTFIQLKQLFEVEIHNNHMVVTSQRDEPLHISEFFKKSGSSDKARPHHEPAKKYMYEDEDKVQREIEDGD